MKFHLISMKNGKCLCWYYKGGKASIQLFTENMTKELYVSIIEKRLKEMETMGGKTLS